ncbi:hypothetical protein ABZ135_01880 [Streptomyces sp. NPDC006339]|uniref:hypothetical protein n=1 Tax=Streptomyces sp. NPDC006339 TaxID=3156755 RepID=UPI0033AD7083
MTLLSCESNACRFEQWKRYVAFKGEATTSLQRNGISAAQRQEIVAMLMEITQQPGPIELQ